MIKSRPKGLFTGLCTIDKSFSNWMNLWASESLNDFSSMSKSDLLRGFHSYIFSHWSIPFPCDCASRFLPMTDLSCSLAMLSVGTRIKQPGEMCRFRNLHRLIKACTRLYVPAIVLQRIQSACQVGQRCIPVDRHFIGRIAAEKVRIRSGG